MMNIREEIIKALKEVKPTQEEITIIARGKAEIARGDLVDWRDLKKGPRGDIYKHGH